MRLWKAMRMVASGDSRVHSNHVSKLTAMVIEERRAHDEFIDHVVLCNSCFAENNTYCKEGLALKSKYDNLATKRINYENQEV